MIRLLKQWLAHRRLTRLITKRRQSFETQDYAKRRKAALRHTPRSWVA